jgi:pSer/pThr/pTyr-binding forkhead associated (FHA) protein
MPHLRVILGDQFGHAFSLKPGTNLIGRDPWSDIILPLESPASRRHAEIFCREGEWMLRDLQSINGTYLNTVRILDASLNHGDEISIGDTVLIFEYGDRKTSETEEAASSAIPQAPKGLQSDSEVIALVHSVPEKIAKLEHAFVVDSAARAALIRQLVMAILVGGTVVIFGIEDSALPPGVRQFASARPSNAENDDSSTKRIHFGINAAGALRDGEMLPELEEFLPQNEIKALRTAVHDFPADESLIHAAVHIVCATRPEYQQAPSLSKRYIEIGATPASAKYIILGAKARAILKGRTHVTIEDMEKTAASAIRHHIKLNERAQKDGANLETILARIVDSAFEPS